jgi:hypothetical protein
MTSPEQQGIRGWLLVVAVVLALFATRTAFYVLTFATAFQVTPDISLTFAAVFELVGNALLVVGAVSLLVLLLRKQRSFPRFAVAFFIAMAAFAMVDLALAVWYRDLAAELRVPWRKTILLTAVCVMAVCYLRRSERVRATFTR